MLKSIAITLGGDVVNFFELSGKIIGIAEAGILGDVCNRRNFLILMLKMH